MIEIYTNNEIDFRFFHTLKTGFHQIFSMNFSLYQENTSFSYIETAQVH